MLPFVVYCFLDKSLHIDSCLVEMEMENKNLYYVYTMSFYTIRVTTDDHEWVSNVLLSPIKRNDFHTYCVAEAVGSSTKKPHIHFLYFCEKEKHSAIVKRITSAGYIGNEMYGTKFHLADELEIQIRYFSKGEARGQLPIIIKNSMNLSSEQILEYHTQYWDIKEGIRAPDRTVKDKVTLDKEEEQRKRSEFQKKLRWVKEQGAHSGMSGWELCDLVQRYYCRKGGSTEPNFFQLKCITMSLARQMACDEYAEKEPHRFANYLKNRSREIIGSEWIYP